MKKVAESVACSSRETLAFRSRGFPQPMLAARSPHQQGFRMRLHRVLLPIVLAMMTGAGLMLDGAPSAYASACGDGSLTFSGGQGTAASPFVIATEADLVALREGWTTTPSYYSCSYRQSADITLTTVWEHGIGFSTPGSALYKPFDGTYDGDGHSVTNLVINALTVSRPNQGRELGFIGLSTSGTAALRNLNLVNATISCGYETQFAAMLVGEISGTVERSSASGAVNCAGADGIARMGGLIGYTNGSVMNAWVSGTVTLPTTYTFAPNSIGGVIGKSFSAASIQNVLGRVSLVNAGQGTYVGAFAGWAEGARSANLVQSGLTSGLTTLNGVGSSPVNVEFKTSAELQDISTYTGWSISAGVSRSTVWGIDPAINGGYPFLQPLPRAADDPSQVPAPILQQVPVLESGSCEIEDDATFGYSTGLRGGWSRSWAQWVSAGEGGPVCTRTLVYVGSRWTVL
jgi:hypothetical protein